MVSSSLSFRYQDDFAGQLDSNPPGKKSSDGKRPGFPDRFRANNHGLRSASCSATSTHSLKNFQEPEGGDRMAAKKKATKKAAKKATKKAAKKKTSKKK